MMKKLYPLFCVTLICILLPLSIEAVTPSQVLDQTLQQAANQGLADNQSVGASAVELSVLLPGEDNPRDFVAGNQLKGFGIHPATTNMMVQYGSITKEYTTTLILHLVDQGYFSLDTPIGHLSVLQPEFESGEWPARWKTVTIAELLNMTSGIPENVSNTDIVFNPFVEYTFNQMIDFASNYENNVKDHPSCAQEKDITNGCFKPGTEYFYSNTNYMIAGLIVQAYYDQWKGSEFTFGEIMDIAILKPVLGDQVAPTCLAGPGHVNALCYSTAPLPDNVLVNMIHGYYNNGPDGPYLLPDMDVSRTNLSWGNAAGALGGTTDGLARLTRALFQNEFDSAPRLTSTQYMVEETSPGQPVIPVKNIEQDCLSASGGCYGLGVQVMSNFADDKNLGTVYAYGGQTLGFGTVYIWIPKENVVLTFSINSSADDNINDLVISAINAINTYLGCPPIPNTKSLSVKISSLFH